jgi:hypothetical protein
MGSSPDGDPIATQVQPHHVSPRQRAEGREIIAKFLP